MRRKHSTAIVLDIDSSVSEIHCAQEGSAENGHSVLIKQAQPLGRYRERDNLPIELTV